MKALFPILSAALLISSVCLANDREECEMNAYIDALMSKMTTEEKIGQLNLPSFRSTVITGAVVNKDIEQKVRDGKVGAILNVPSLDKIEWLQKIAVEETRLGIPLIFGRDIVHGFRTTFPVPLALSTSWDIEAIEETARIQALESSAEGLDWTYSPMVDIARDPRWGRIVEGAGEDPFLGSAISAAMVRGYQGDSFVIDTTRMMACVKHFAAYGAAEAGRDYNTVDMSELRLRSDYLPPYKAAVDAGAGSVMASFNELGGIPATGNKWLLTTLLRDEWGFKGFVVTDYTAILEMIDHGVGDFPEVSAKALDAGIDMDMVSEGFTGTLTASLENGRIKMEAIDAACRRVLEAKYRLGLFDNPYRYINHSRPARDCFKPESRAFARKVAGESITLLENDGVLPLEKGCRLALVGNYADDGKQFTGPWSGAPAQTPASLLKGLEDAGFDVRCSQGCDIKAARKAASKADVIIVAIGEKASQSGEASCRANIVIEEDQRQLLEAMIATGKKVVPVVFAGRPLILTDIKDRVSALLYAWFPGCESAAAVADILGGSVNPSSRLTVSFPRSIGQIPVYYSHKNTGRPYVATQKKYSSRYLDELNDPLYPFGYGLSYGACTYSDVTLSSDRMDRDGSVTASVTISNDGIQARDEVVQLYIRDLVGSVTRPVSELKGFRRVHLEPGQKTVVDFKIDSSLLKFWNADLQYVLEDGEFEVMIGPNSRDVKKAGFRL